jgi:tetratricopeptide (TPR) repeat protein
VLDSDWKVDHSVYRSEDTRGMFVNFSVAAFQLAQRAFVRKDYPEAVRWAELSHSLNPNFEYPKRYLGLYYSRAGDFEKAKAHYRGEIDLDPANGEFWMGLASIHEEAGDIGGALEVLEEGTRSATDYRDLFAHGFRLSATLGRREQARGFIRRWIDVHPEDREFRSLYDNIDKVLDTEFGAEGNSSEPDSSGEEN